MKLHATIGAYESDVEVRIEGTRVFAQVGGRAYQFDFRQAGDENLLLISDDGVFDCRVDVRAQSGAPLDVIVGTTHHTITLTDPKRLRSSTAAGAHAGGAARILAPMPGKVVRVLVSAGAEVQAGDGIAVVEAMKMQNELKSPRAGAVVSINVEVGATVNGGDVLAVIE